MKNIRDSTNNFLKKLLIKVISVDRAYENLEKLNTVPSETIASPEAKNILFFKNSQSFQIDFYKTPVSYTTILNGVFYCPEYNILLTKDRKIILESFISTNVRKSVDLRKIFTNKIENVIGECLIYHQLKSSYYHSLIDNIPRLYLACQHKHIQKSQFVKLIHSQRFSQVDNFFLPKILPANVITSPVRNGKLYYLEKLIFAPFLTSHHNGCLPQAYREKIFSKYTPQRNRNKKERIFISRQKASNSRHILNEDEVFNFLQALGFKKYTLEDMTIPEQIELFYDAEIVLGTHGAGLTNIIFSENIKLVELFPCQTVIPHYYYLSKSMGHDYQYWCGSETSRNSNFFVDVAQLKLINL